MASNTPNIICNIKAHQYYSSTPSRSSCNSDLDFKIKERRYNKSQFYRCNQEFDVVKYLERPEAIETSSQRQLEQILEIEQQSSYKQIGDILSYASTRPGSTGAFGRKGQVINNKEIREKLRNTKSTIWSGVLSFTESYAKQFCNTKEDAENLMNEALETLFISQGLEPQNVSYFCAFHTNKGRNVYHPHIHFIYWENEPTKLNSKGELSYSKFMIPQKAIYDFKYNVAKYHQSLGKVVGSELMFSLRDGIKDSFKVRSVEEHQYERWMKLNSALGENRSTQFARLTKEQREVIRQFIDEVINSNPELLEKWNQYMDELNKKFLEIKKLHQENNMPLSKAAKTYCKSRIDELYSRCGNTVLKSLNIICAAQKKFDEESNQHSRKNPKKESLTGKVKTNNPVQQQRNQQGKNSLFSFIARVITEQNKELYGDINEELNKFYSELKKKGDISIYE